MFRGSLRLLRYRLLIPMLRSKEGPQFRARGVLIGLLCAMTPLVGVQMAMVAGVWAVQRLIVPNWRFSVVIAMAWTWVTNVFTVPPLYYLFLLTGQLMLGRRDRSISFDAFAVELDSVLETDGHFLEAVWNITVGMLQLWGLPMFLGCIPWAIASGWIGYRWSLRFISRHRSAADAG